MSKWPMVRLGDVCLINPSKKSTIDQYEGKEVSFVPMSSVGEDGSIDVSDKRFYSEVVNGFTYFIENDVLFAKITPCMENGKGAIAKGLINGLGVGSTEFHVLRAFPDAVLSEWIFLFLSSPKVRKSAEKNMTGSAGQKRVPKEFLEEIPIPLPSLNIQKSYVAVLYKAREIIDGHKRQLEELGNLAKAVFIDMFGDPARNDKGWEMSYIRDLVKSTQYGSSEKASTQPLEYPILRMNNITYSGEWDFSDLKYINLSENDKKKYMIHKGELLFNRTNSKELVGKAAAYRENYPMAFAGYLIKLTPNERANNEFLSAFLNSAYGKLVLRSMAKSIIGMANINAKELGSIRVNVPPIDLQTRFAEIVTQIETQKSLVKQSLVESQNLFNSLMSRYFD